MVNWINQKTNIQYQKGTKSHFSRFSIIPTLDDQNPKLVTPEVLPEPKLQKGACPQVFLKEVKNRTLLVRTHETKSLVISGCGMNLSNKRLGRIESINYPEYSFSTDECVSTISVGLYLGSGSRAKLLRPKVNKG